MQHCDPELLALAALGEPLPAQDAAHLSSCAQCLAEVEDLARVVSAARVEVPAGPPVEPPSRVWQAVAASTGVRPDLLPVAATGQPAPAGSAAPAALPQQGAAAVSVPPSAPSPQSPPSPVVPLRPRARSRRPGRGLLVAVAASALVVGAAGGSLVTHAVSQQQPATAAVLAQIPLAALATAPGAAGEASVVRTKDQATDLVVDVSSLGDLPGHFYEVWLIDRDVKKMVAVGILHGPEGRFTIPASVDLEQYPIVDISVQQPGDPKHSGNSVLRGTLPA